MQTMAYRTLQIIISILTGFIALTAIGGGIALLVGLGGAWPKWFVDGTKGLEKMEPGSMLFVFSL